MAGEKKGKAYEALVHIALEDLIASKKLAGPLHWNITPKAMSIEPDFMTGGNTNDPTTILLLNHSGSAKESEKKMWRNLGELVEAKTVLPSVQRVYCLTLGNIKADLEPLQRHAFDQFVWIRQATHPWASDLDSFITSCSPNLPTGKDNQVRFVKSTLATASGKVRTAYSNLRAVLDSMYKSKTTALDKMWLDHRKRSHPKVPGARTTFVRRGASKLYLFPDHKEAYRCFKNNSAFTSAVDHLKPLGLVEKRAAGWFPCKDAEIISCVRLLTQPECLSLFAKAKSTDGFRQQAAKVRDSALLFEYVNWCKANWPQLVTPTKMKQTLLVLHNNPATGIQVPKGCNPPTHIWIMDVLGAIERASSKKSQSYGLSALTNHPSGKSQRIGNLFVGDWCSRFMTGFLTRKANFTPPAVALDFFAKALSDLAKKVSKAQVSAASVLDKYIAKELEAVYLSHRGFDPLWILISNKLPLAKTLTIATCYAEAAALSGRTGTCRLAKIQETFIYWQTCSDAGRDHKKKELCGRAIGIRYEWIGKAFARRRKTKKLILVLDGTWRQDDLGALLRSGWDEVYYPDEMALLAKAIV